MDLVQGSETENRKEITRAEKRFISQEICVQIEDWHTEVRGGFLNRFQISSGISQRKKRNESLSSPSHRVYRSIMIPGGFLVLKFSVWVVSQLLRT